MLFNVKTTISSPYVTWGLTILELVLICFVLILIAISEHRINANKVYRKSPKYPYDFTSRRFSILYESHYDYLDESVHHALAEREQAEQEAWENKQIAERQANNLTWSNLPTSSRDWNSLTHEMHNEVTASRQYSMQRLYKGLRSCRL